ncbi:hypothetical protein QJQ45_027043 [Haematococcus lacustris]|nr:hypothetical protein QJQ45_027043 [Haematococcus lacustris]
MPTVLNVFTWAWGTLSLFLHFIAVFTTAAIALVNARLAAATPPPPPMVLHHNGHRVFAAAIACLYLLSHYLMAVIMYMEQDRVARAGRYNLSEFSVFAQRLVDVALYDIQLLASLVHSNTMIEGLTQMLLKGYEEARGSAVCAALRCIAAAVCVHMLVNTLPMCVMLGVLYDGVVLQWIEFEDLDIQSYQQQIWIALVFSVLNALEKWLRLSLADPWLHPRNDDRYPLLYMRSNASRLPRGLMMDWLFRCNTQLQRHDDHLVLREVFAVYVFNCKGDARELCDGHKAYLLKKALRTFNSANTFNRAETVARRLAKTKLPDSRSIQYLDASNIRPGRYMSSMLGGGAGRQQRLRGAQPSRQLPG